MTSSTTAKSFTDEVTSHPLLSTLSLVVAVWVTRRIATKLRTRDDVKHLPGPARSGAHWLWGYERAVFDKQACQSYSEWMDAYGSMFKVKAALAHNDIIVAADHAAVQHIFADTDNYVKSPAFRPPIEHLIGRGLVWAEGDVHRKQRHLLAPAFSQDAVKGMASDIGECAEKLESRLTNQILIDGGLSELNIVNWVSPCTLDIIGKVGFGHDFQFGESSEARSIIDSWTTHINVGLGAPGFLAPIVFKSVPGLTKLLPTVQSQGIVKQVTRKLAFRLIEQGAQRGSGAEKGKDILSILLRAAGKDGGLSADEIVDNLSTFTLVGNETVAGSICFTLWELAKHPEMQHRLREEIVCSGTRQLAFDDINKLTYLDAVVKEGLRLHPASPQTERIALHDDVIPLSTPIRTSNGNLLTSLRVSAGQVFHVPFMSMQTYKPTWGEDAGAFKPERWLDGPDGLDANGEKMLPPPSALPRGWSNLVTFCDGPRNCIGYRLALYEFKVIMVTLLRSFEFSVTDRDADIQRKISQTMQPVLNGEAGLLPLKVSLVSA